MSIKLCDAHIINNNFKKENHKTDILRNQNP